MGTTRLYERRCNTRRQQMTRATHTNFRILLALLPILTACVTHQHKPDPAELVESADCTVVNGDYTVGSQDAGRALAESLFGEDEVVSALAIKKTAGNLTVDALTSNGRNLPTANFNRVSCTDSVLKVILRDAYSANGVLMNASDRALELFAPDEGSVNLRFIDSTLAFFFIVPYYSSSDDLITLQRQPADAE